MTSTANVTAHLAHHVSITQLLNRYTDAVNRREWDALAEVFCDDGVWDIGGPPPSPTTILFTGRDEVVSGIAKLVGAMAMLVQTNHAAVIEIHGSTATATSTIEERGYLGADQPAPHVMGTYYDDIVRENDGEWRFKKRTFRFTYAGQWRFDGQLVASFPVHD